eukprot:maker-scaffold_3-augustus-gene-4.59-mRNA-1 protein AED:0.01 eAED:0.01 QI:138/1/1/1/0/1/2/691/531
MPRFRKKIKSGSNASNNPSRMFSGDSSGARSKSTINRLNMYKNSKPKRDRTGKIVKGDFMLANKVGNKDVTADTGRVAPNRRWFGNTKTITQKELDDFRTRLTEKVHDPYAVLLKRKNLPMGLLLESNTNLGGEAIRINSDGMNSTDPEGFKTFQGKILTSESFDYTFGPKKQRKRPKIGVKSLEMLTKHAESRSAEYNESKNENDLQTKDKLAEKELEKQLDNEDIFMKGQSKRIWSELYKVIDSSDVVVQILDARDPFGTRSLVLEDYIATKASHKHLIFIINKIDLIPTKLAKQWLKILSKSHPTLLFHAELNKPFGKGSLIQLLRQFKKLHPEKPQISVGFVGMPNVGKSSIINAVKSKKVCNVAPIPGETKVWQYITLFKDVFLIDCPGVVYPDKQMLLDTVDQSKEKLEASTTQQGENFCDKELMYESELVLKGVVRAEKLSSPTDYIPYIVRKVGRLNIIKQYQIDFETAQEFLKRLAKKRGRLLKGGEPDMRIIAQQVIYDLQRGKIVYYVKPTEEQLKLLEN